LHQRIVLRRKEPDRSLLAVQLRRHWSRVAVLHAVQPQHHCAVGLEGGPQFVLEFARGGHRSTPHLLYRWPSNGRGSGTVAPLERKRQRAPATDERGRIIPDVFIQQVTNLWQRKNNAARTLAKGRRSLPS